MGRLLRRRSNIKPPLAQRLMFAEMTLALVFSVIPETANEHLINECHLRHLSIEPAQLIFSYFHKT